MSKKTLVLSVLAAIVLLSVVLLIYNNKGKVEDETLVTDDTVPISSEPVEENQGQIKIDIKPLSEYDEKAVAEAAATLGFENVNLFAALANAIGVEPAKITQSDIDDVHYISLSKEDSGTYTLLIGHVNYVDLCFSEEADQPGIIEKLNKIVMASDFAYDVEKDSLSDLAKFKNVEMFEIYDVKISDVSFIKEYKGLTFGYFKNNGITDVSSLADYNPESLYELDFTGNEISDWSYLEHIKEKVIVFYGSNGFKDENGDDVVFSLTLASKLEQEAQRDEAPEEETQTQDEMVLVDENGNPVDFGSLFE